MFLLAGGLTTAMVIAVACSFPEPKLVPDDGGATTGDSPFDNATGDGDTGSDGAVQPDIAVPDSPPPIDANGGKPDVDVTGCLCDCDKDHFRDASQAFGSCNNTVPDAAPFDCDDLDPRAFPDAGFVTDQPTADTRGDWNCDKAVTRHWNVNIKCSDYNEGIPGVGLDCTTIEGFTGDPACGETATYVFCANAAIGAACAQDHNEQRPQGCK